MKKTIILLFIIQLLITGCKNLENSDNVINKSRSSANINDYSTNIYKRNTPYENKNSLIDKNKFEEDTDWIIKRNKISDVVTNIFGIQKASVVVAGNTAIIGIHTVNDLNDEKLIKLKEKIEAKVKECEPSLQRIAVTSSGELVTRISNLDEAISVENIPPNYNDTLENIVRKLTPPV